MRQAIYQYAQRAGEKLRQERQFTHHIGVFIKTPPFAEGEVFYGNVASERLLLPTRDTRDIIAAAMKALNRIWIDRHRYAKAGIMLDDFFLTGVAQLNLFSDEQPRENSEALMKIIDIINTTGL